MVLPEPSVEKARAHTRERAPLDEQKAQHCDFTSAPKVQLVEAAMEAMHRAWVVSTASKEEGKDTARGQEGVSRGCGGLLDPCKSNLQAGCKRELRSFDVL